MTVRTHSPPPSLFTSLEYQLFLLQPCGHQRKLRLHFWWTSLKQTSAKTQSCENVGVQNSDSEKCCECLTNHKVLVCDVSWLSEGSATAFPELWQRFPSLRSRLCNKEAKTLWETSVLTACVWRKAAWSVYFISRFLWWEIWRITGRNWSLLDFYPDLLNSWAQ